MRLADGIFLLQLSASFMGDARVINPVLLWDNNEGILVDTGLPAQLQPLTESVQKTGLSFENIRKVIITHHDIDHIGSLADIIDFSQGKIEVLSHCDEQPYIEGKKKPLKSSPEFIKRIQGQIEAIPQPEIRSKVMNSLNRMYTTKVDRPLEDSDEIPFLGGIKVIHTPGHTPGHICLYLKNYKMLVSGDALNASEGRLLGPVPQFTPDFELAKSSLKKLLDYEINTIICYHGGIVNDNAYKQLKDLIASF